MGIQKTALEGSILSKNRPPQINFETVNIGGVCGREQMSFKLNEDILSKHLMLIGGTGCGKTNTFFHIVSQLKRKMAQNDVMIIFDTKGDYKSKFFDARYDYILSAVEQESNAVWNAFSEILGEGISKEDIDANVAEIAWGLFSDSIRKNNSNPFFPNAAKDLFAAVITCLIRKTGYKTDLINKYLNNNFLRNFFDTLTVSVLQDLVKGQSDQAAVMTYVGDGANPQGLGVFAELQTVIRKIFVGAFAKKGTFSIQKFVQQRQAKTLFIEYDLSHGATLVPIYKLLIDLALKESMGNNAKNRANKGNVYIFCDEFKLLPELLHIEDAVNFGRSLGIKVFAGLQSIDQLIENYGEARAKNIISGFSSVLSFRANDESTRQFVVGKFGKNYVLEQNISVGNSINEEKRIGNVVEDWELCNLGVGEAVIGLLDIPPFRFKFDLYR